MTAVDVFAGCGGLTLGLKRAGFDVKVAVELDSRAAATYALNHPEVELLEMDVREEAVEAKLVELLNGTYLDLLAACPPCQGFSTIRTRNRREASPDPRNDLVLKVIDLIKLLQPKTVLLENVPRLASDWRFAKMLQVLDELHYYTSFQIVDAYDYGVPQRRRRLVLAASRISMPELQPKKSRVYRNVRDAIGFLEKPSESNDWLHSHVRPRSQRIQELIRLIPRNGGSRASLPSKHILNCHRQTTGFKDVYGRLAWNYPASTVTSGCTNPSKGRFLHPEEHRALSLREASLLQSFPRKYKFAESSVTALALQIGNAIPPPLAHFHAAVLADTLSPS